MYYFTIIFLGENSTSIDIEFTSVYQDHSVTVDVCPLAGITDASNIIAWLSINIVDNSNINIAIKSNMAKLFPLVPSSPAPLPTDIDCNITCAEATLTVTITETTTEELTLTSTTTEQFNFTETATEILEITVMTTEATEIRTVKTCTAEPLTSLAVTIIRDNNVINPDRIIGDGQVAIASSSLYGTIAAIVIAFIILLLMSIVVCYTSYRCGMSKGKRLEEEYYQHAYDCKSDTHGLVNNQVYE